MSVGMLAFVDIGAGHNFDDVAEVHDGDLMREGLDEPQVVRDETDGYIVLALQPRDKLDDRLLHRHVECARGLVHDDNLGLERDSARNGNALALTTRHVVRIAVCEIAR